MENVKKIAQKHKVKVISCEAYKKAPTTIKLYKKAGFKENLIKSYDEDSLSVKLFVKLDEFGLNLEKQENRNIVK